MTELGRLWLVRHAPVDGPKGVIHAPDAPVDLGDTARLDWLREALPAEAVIVASPSRRTRETAVALGFQPQLEPDFREQDFGTWTGRRHDDLARELGPAYDAFWRDAARLAPPGGESFVDQIDRVRRGLARLPGGDSVLVVHSGTIRAVLAIALGASPDAALSFVIDPLSLTQIDRLGSAGWRIAYVNRVPG
ncbi:histidine phosphatase family protein [Rhodopseudomonas sp. BR0M22]|uniref:histidine phosphatase family protein n=1 Tax=Rhodopseudomonas sp. BR0M22 TaxID=2269369 RepID=UPI0013E0AC4E|nr:histidine phosphatase family protein [Rhodopseudomonas sp. BR0M22]NEW92870.1 histidine phosphatase family protein [Rhodopseudomonas sp. BR0M22]